MELWIRSQNKHSLMKPNNIYIFENVICCECNGKRRLGEYKSQKRALEVLDEIQKVIMPKYIISNFPDDKVKNLNQTFKYNYDYIQSNGNINIRELGNYIYEMPKE